MKKRLSKALAAAGIASRRAAETMIEEGRVLVNGHVVKVPQTLVEWGKDKIKVDGSYVKGEEEKVAFVLNKPRGFICTSAADKKKRVIDLFDPDLGRLFTVGRLDRDTAGLLIVTNDGHFANQLIHPSSNIEKEYLAKVDREVMHTDLLKISKGCMIEHVFVKPKRVAKVRKGTLKVVVAEGKKREVRVMLEKAGFEVRELTRIRLGHLVLSRLPEGHFRELTNRDRELLLQKDAPKIAKPRKKADEPRDID